MKKFSIVLSILILLVYPLCWAADTTYGTKVYHERGGDRVVVASGGSIAVESGGTIDIEGGGKITGLAVNIAATHAYTLAEDWVLSAAEMLCTLLVTSSGSGDANIVEVGGSAGRIRVVRNGSAGTVTMLESGQTGIAIATGKTAVVMHNGTDYIRVTADATH